MINIWSFLGAFLTTFFLIPITINLAKKYGFVDDPKKHKHPALIHKKIIPRAGGLPIFIGLTIGALLTIDPSKKLIGILFGGLILTIGGLLDDFVDLKLSKFWFQIAAALVAVAGGVGITFITNPLGGVIMLDNVRLTFDFLGVHSILVWADLFALLWIVWVINMVNFSSGVDGQMPGIVFIALFVLFAASFKFIFDGEQAIVLNLALAGMGATLAFLIFNFYPAKIFPGDSGSNLLGFLVAVLAILSGAKVGTAILVIAIPLIDGVFTIFKRVLAGKSPFVGDRGHLHHKLMEFGWGQRRISLFYWLLCAILGAIALGVGGNDKVFAILVITVIILGGLIWLNLTLPLKDQK